MMIKLATAALALLGSVTLATAATKHCLRVDDIEAEQAMHFQAELMVESDTCGAKTYVQFARRNQDALAEYQRHMIARFRRDGVAHAEQRFDSYLTRLANEVSLRDGAEPITTVCQNAAPLLATADSMGKDEFRRYIAQQAEAHRGNYRRCRG